GGQLLPLRPGRGAGRGQPRLVRPALALRAPARGPRGAGHAVLRPGRRRGRATLRAAARRAARGRPLHESRGPRRVPRGRRPAQRALRGSRGLGAQGYPQRGRLGDVLERPHHHRVRERHLARPAVPGALVERSRGDHPMKATQALHDLGQSLWLDNISRDLLKSGTLERTIRELAVTGLTSNPTIFDQAIKNGPVYDAAIREKVRAGRAGEALFFELA